MHLPSPLRGLNLPFTFVLIGALAALSPACASKQAPAQPAAKSTAKPSAPTRAAADNASVEALTAQCVKSLVVISHYGRDGQVDGVGTGFVIDADGLIATSLHVIGEARPIAVHLADGSRHEVVEVHAWDRKFDLAILRIAAKNLPALPLGDSDALKQGSAVLALGNPQGLEHSVVKGVVSARRDVEGNEMIQIAIPIEQGNSGGPLVDLDGRVHGVLTLKSAVTANLGFAMPVNLLKPLLEKPNPVPMARWLTIGALNEREWKASAGARWTQRSGRLKVEGFGKGFGGRSLCLSQQPVPEPPYELAVTVKLDDEAGAAGLVFGADGGDRHWGFYPSAGQLRLTRFDGPDVFSWQVLQQIPTKAYHPRDWNTLKVRVEKDTVKCFVNDELVTEADYQRFAGAKVGLAKFRNTAAEFKVFQAGAKVGPEAIPGELAASLTTQLDALGPEAAPELVTALQKHPGASQSLLLERARRLEKQARQLRSLADSVHQKSVESDLMKLLERDEADIDLAHAALLIARLDNDELDVNAYRRQVDRMAAELKAKIAGMNSTPAKPARGSDPARWGETPSSRVPAAPKRLDGVSPHPPNAASDPEKKLNTLREYLFKDCGFHGSRTDYYNRANSYLNEVIDDREGLPITLSVLFVELARRIGLDEVAATSMPGHLLVKFTPGGGAVQLIDVFDGGKLLTRAEAAELIESVSGLRLRDEHLRAATKRELVARILRNLMSVAERNESPAAALRYLDLIVALYPESALERLTRGMLRLRTGNNAGAREDLKWLLDTAPPGLDLDRVGELYRSL